MDETLGKVGTNLQHNYAPGQNNTSKKLKEIQGNLQARKNLDALPIDH